MKVIKEAIKQYESHSDLPLFFDVFFFQEGDKPFQLSHQPISKEKVLKLIEKNQVDYSMIVLAIYENVAGAKQFFNQYSLLSLNYFPLQSSAVDLIKTTQIPIIKDLYFEFLAELEEYFFTQVTINNYGLRYSIRLKEKNSPEEVFYVINRDSDQNPHPIIAEILEQYMLDQLIIYTEIKQPGRGQKYSSGLSFTYTF